MKTWVRRSLNVGVLGAGFLLVSGGAAHADQVSGPNAGIATGNQLSSVLQLPIDISGNAVSVLGFADASSVGGAGAVNTESATTEAGQVSGFNTGILTGNQISNVVQVPISVCGNSIAVLGFADASCVGGAAAVNGGGGGNGSGSGSGGHGHGHGHGGGNSNGGGYGNSNGGGYGNSRGSAGYGDTADDGYNTGGGRGAYADDADYEHARNRGGARGMGGGSGALSNGGANQVTGYNAGILAGNQVSSVIQAPIDVSGNAISVLGFASASSVGGAGAVNESATTEAGQVSGFNAGILTGNQVSSVVQVPISVCGNSIAVLGFADASCVGGAAAVNGGGGGGNWTPPARDDDDDDNGGPAGNYGGQGAGRTYSAGHGSAHGANKAATKAAKKSHKKSHKMSNENGNWGGQARGNSRGNGHGQGRGNAGYTGGAAGYNGGGSGHGHGGGSGSGGGASADGGSCGGDQVTGYNAGLLSGNQFSSVIQMPIDLSGNAISILGFASASSVGGAAAVNC